MLKNLELDAVYISDITNLPPWLEISSIVCDNIKVEVSSVVLRKYYTVNSRYNEVL